MWILRVLISVSFLLSYNFSWLYSQAEIKNNSKWELQVAPYYNFRGSIQLIADNGSYIKDTGTYSFAARIIRHFPLKYWDNIDFSLSIGLNSYPLYAIKTGLYFPSFSNNNHFDSILNAPKIHDRMTFFEYLVRLTYKVPGSGWGFTMGSGVVSLPGSGDFTHPFNSVNPINSNDNGGFVSIPPDYPITYHLQTPNPFYSPIALGCIGINRQFNIQRLRLNVNFLWVWSFRPFMNLRYYLIEDANTGIVLNTYGDKYINNLELQIGLPLFRFAKKKKEE